MIPYGHQSIDEDDIAAVVKVLRGDWLTQGPEVDAFEEALADAVGARYAVAFSSGTAALHGAVLAAELGPGDVLATSPLSFVASANCALFVGATPSLIDIRPDTLNLDLDAVPSDATALVPVHFAGLPLDLSGIRRRPRIVIEDAAHALGATTPDGPVGNCAHSDMCMFSFHPVKTVTTGEGGAVTTNNAKLADRLRHARNHGICRPADQPGWYYEVTALAPNYRLTDLQAALGRSQLVKLDRFVQRRNAIADRYRDMLDLDEVLLPPAAPPDSRHGYHLFPVRVADRRTVYDAMRQAGIGVQVHFVPIYRHPLYARLGFLPDDYPETERAYESLLSLPIFPDLTDDAQNRVVSALTDAVSRARAG